MKRTFFNLITLLVLLSSTAVAQIDYHAHPQIISNKDSVIVIDWLVSSPKKCPIGFNHLVNFLPMVNENPNTTVGVELYQNKKLLRSFNFSVGDHANRIYTYEDLNLKRGDHVYLVFTLRAKLPNEQYVFNVYEEPRAAVKTVIVIKDNGVRVSDVKPKVVKYKNISIAQSRRNMRKPIGQEINGRYN